MNNDKKIMTFILALVALISLGATWYSLTHTIVEIRSGWIPKKILRIDDTLKYKNYEVIESEFEEQLIIYFDKED